MVLYQHSTGEKYLDYLLMVTWTTYSNFLNNAASDEVVFNILIASSNLGTYELIIRPINKIIIKCPKPENIN